MDEDKEIRCSNCGQTAAEAGCKEITTDCRGKICEPCSKLTPLSPQRQLAIGIIKKMAQQHFSNCVKCGMAAELGVMFRESIDFEAFKRRGGCDEGVHILKCVLIAIEVQKVGEDGIPKLLAQVKAAKEAAKKKLENPPEPPKPE